MLSHTVTIQCGPYKRDAQRILAKIKDIPGIDVTQLGISALETLEPEIADQPISNLNLPRSAMTALVRGWSVFPRDQRINDRVITIGLLASKTEQQILGITNIGPKALAMIKSELSQYNLSLRAERR